MIKLYNEIDGHLHYWETWETGKSSATIHWGKVGDTGQSRDVKRGLFSSHTKTIEKEIEKMRSQGFSEIPDEKLMRLIVEYKARGFGNESDLEKRHALEDFLQEKLGWTGLGYCDGGSNGRGTMETCSFVVDFHVAKEILTQELKDTEFSNYLRIYLEE